MQYRSYLFVDFFFVWIKNKWQFHTFFKGSSNLFGDDSLSLTCKYLFESVHLVELVYRDWEKFGCNHVIDF